MRKMPNKFITLIFVLILLFGILQFFKYISEKRQKTSQIQQTAQVTSTENLDSNITDSALKPTEEASADNYSGGLEKTEETVEETTETQDNISPLEKIKQVFNERNPFSFSKKRSPYKEYEDTDSLYDEFYDTNDKDGEDEQKGVQFKVTSILIGEDVRLAIINIEPFELYIGDSFYNEVVTDISKDHIVLSKNGNKRVVDLELSNFSKSQIKMEGVQ